MNTTNNVSSHLVPEADRLAFVDKLFGINYVLKLEPTVFRFAEQLAAPVYNGGYWQFFALSNGGFYMAPRLTTIFDVNGETTYAVSCENGFEGKLSADALGLTACLYAYSHLSFGDGLANIGQFADTCADQYHLLREHMFGHPEVRSILGAID